MEILKTPVMREEYDFSKAVKNPFVRKPDKKKAAQSTGQSGTKKD